MRLSLVLLFIVLVSLVDYSSSWWWFAGKGAKKKSNLSPIVIVPGIAGNQLKGRLVGKPKTVSWYCQKTTSGYFHLWLNIKSLLPWSVECWQDNMKLVYNTETMEASNSPGVVTMVPGFGRTETVETLDPYGLIAYMEPLVDFLVTLGYQRNTNVRAAPYDFRYEPSQLPHNYYKKLQNLIESSYEENGNIKVSLISHSYGCPITLNFLNKMGQSWKDKYLKQWIPVSGVFGGTVQELRLYGSGYTLGITPVLLNPLKIRHEERTFTSSLFLLPSPQVWKKGEIFVKTPKRTYDIDQINDFLNDVGFPDGVPMRQKVGTIHKVFRSPGVRLNCYYGNKRNSTVEMLIYGKHEFPNRQPTIVRGDGDETVNLRSLKLCKELGNLQNKISKVREIRGTNHNGILSNEEFHTYLKDDLFS